MYYPNTTYGKEINHVAQINKSALRQQKEALLEQVKQIEYELIKDYVDERKKKGLHPNKLSVCDLVRIIKHFFDNGSGMVSKSFKAIYEMNTDPLKRERGMEVDWVEKMANRSYSLEILVQALDHLREYEPLKPLYTSKIFKPKHLLQASSITAGIRYMDTIVKMELEIIRLEELVATYEEERMELTKQRIKQDWKSVALDLISKGHTHKEVAELVGKSTKTIQRLLKTMTPSSPLED